MASKAAAQIRQGSVGRGRQLGKREGCGRTEERPNQGEEGRPEVNRSRGTNNKMQWKTKLVEGWYALSYRAGDHNRRQESGINRL